MLFVASLENRVALSLSYCSLFIRKMYILQILQRNENKYDTIRKDSYIKDH